MKLNKNLVITFSALIILMGCQSVKNTLTLKKDQSVDEFLIEKKNPLVVPPDYSKLPKPREEVDKEKDNTDIDLTKVLDGSKNTSNNSKKSNSSSDIEKSISNILNKK